MSEAFSASSPEPKLVLPLGRGGRGKSFLLRWLIERAQGRGRTLVVADVDRTNATLSAFFDGVLSPPSAHDADVKEFLASFIEEQIEKRFDAAIDLGGGDLILKQIARETELVSFLSSHRIKPVAIHLIGAATDDLAYLQAVEDGVFAPEATILVINEATVPPHRTAFAAFEKLQTHPVFMKAIERGAVAVRMPRLEPASEMDAHRLTFSAAESGSESGDKHLFGPWRRQQVAIWRRQMEESFAPVAAWLP